MTWMTVLQLCVLITWTCLMVAVFGALLSQSINDDLTKRGSR